MGKLIDLVGKRFGRLTVASRSKPVGNKTMWLCVCECGSETAVEGYNLRSGHIRSCGCLRVDVSTARALKEISGQRFGRLIAIERAEQERMKKSKWRCLCDCGAESLVSIDKLLSGHTTSCGCARLDQPRLSPPSIRLANVIHASRRRARIAMAPGAFTAEDVARMLTLQRGRCAWCAVRLIDGMHRDHRTALSAGGTNDRFNIELLCPRCNLRKGAKDPIAWAQQNGRLI